jgi:hypothetical protein
MKIACAPKGTEIKGKFDFNVVLYDWSDDRNEGQIGGSIIHEIKRLGLSPSQLSWDFLSIAMAVISADEAVPRFRSGDGWTRTIDLTVSVANPKPWKASAATLEEALKFLTTDVWRLKFVSGGLYPKPTNVVARSEDCVCLLSGGLDSLVGGLDIKAMGHAPLLVSQVAKGDKDTQREFAQAIEPKLLHLQLNHNARPPKGFSERSQRARSIIFLAYAVLAATTLKTYASGKPIPIFIPENGYISFNPPLTILRLGSHSTRTTHPHYLGLLQRVLDDVGLEVNLVNPYQFKTKGEMLKGCKQKALLTAHAGKSTSCGRYARNAFTHCGRCVPCLIRRAAFHKLGTDTTRAYRYADIEKPGPKLLDFDDVRSMAMAIETVHQRGAEGWLGSALDSLPITGRQSYIDVADRGISEMAAFLRARGVL